MIVYNDLDNLPYNQSEFPIVFSSGYLQWQQSLGFSVLVIGDDHQAYLPVSIHKKYGFKRGRFLFVPYNKEHKLNAPEEKDFLNRLRIFLKEKRIADVMYPPMHICVFKGLPESVLAAKLGIVRVPLFPRTEEEIFFRFQPQYRNIIRKAEKDGVQVFFGMNCFDDFYAVYHDTIMREKLIPDQRSVIRELATQLGEEHIQCGVAYLEGKPQAALFNFYNEIEAFNVYAGTTCPSHHKGAMKLLHWNAIRLLLEKKVKRYCLGGVRRGKITGTKYEQISDFKLRFGADTEEGYHLIMPLTPQYSLYKRFLQIYLRVKGIRQYNETMPYQKIK